MKNSAHRISALAVVGAISLSGCASTPSVRATYYLPRALTLFQVTQTFVCPAKKESNTLSVTATVTAATSYSADYSAPEQVINFGGYSSTFADTDLAVTRSADKRLLGINSSTTGEGTTVLQDVISLGTAIAGLAGAAAGLQTHDGVAPPPPAANPSVEPCDVVRAHFTGDADKSPPTLTITYTGNLRYRDPAADDAASQVNKPVTHAAPASLLIAFDDESTVGVPRAAWATSISLVPDPVSAPLVDAMRKAFPSRSNPFAFQVLITGASKLADDANWSDAPLAKDNSGDRAIMLSRVFNADLELQGPMIAGRTVRQGAHLWRGTVQVPTPETYPLPLPRAALFGKTQFTLTLSDAMVITKLEYNTTSGAADATTAATALAKALQPASASDNATKWQGKADEIYQKNRYAVCAADASACQSK